MSRAVINILTILISIWALSCSNIKMLTPSDIYSENFLKQMDSIQLIYKDGDCLLYTSPSPRDKRQSRMPSSA